MLVHAPTPETNLAAPRPPVTYGDLIEATCHAVTDAILLPRTQALGPEALLAELDGYQRFLHTSGLHLRLLGTYQPDLTREQRQLIPRLTSHPIQDPATSSWLRAAQNLGAAHDLLATHLGPRHLPRTPEAEDLFVPAAVLGPIRDVTALVLDAVTAGGDLVQSAVNVQKGLSPQPIPPTVLSGLREWNASVRPYAKAAHLDASGLGLGAHTSALSSLQLAPIVDPGRHRGSGFESELEALRILGQLTFAQARGDVGASPLSLHDLALLGATITGQGVSWLPAPTTGLERLAAAQAQDALESAQATWSRAAEDLNQTVLGTTRALRVYAEAIERLRSVETTALTVRLAFLSALPRLGRDASTAIVHLQSQNALVSKQREPGLLTMQWRPISPADAHELSTRFAEAAAASEVASATVRRILAPPDRATRQSADLAPRVGVRRDLEPSRSAQR